mgnify:CR=1
MNLKSIIAGTLAGAVATTPVTANAQEYAGKSAGSAYTMASETPIRDSIEGYASEPNIRLMKTSTGDYVSVSAGRTSVDSIVNSVNKYGSHFIQGDPGKEYMASLASTLQSNGEENRGMGKGTKAAIIALVAGGVVVGYLVSQKGKDKKGPGGTI